MPFIYHLKIIQVLFIRKKEETDESEHHWSRLQEIFTIFASEIDRDAFLTYAKYSDEEVDISSQKLVISSATTSEEEKDIKKDLFFRTLYHKFKQVDL